MNAMSLTESASSAADIAHRAKTFDLVVDSTYLRAESVVKTDEVGILGACRIIKSGSDAWTESPSPATVASQPGSHCKHCSKNGPGGGNAQLLGVLFTLGSLVFSLAPQSAYGCAAGAWHFPLPPSSLGLPFDNVMNWERGGERHELSNLAKELDIRSGS